MANTDDIRKQMIADNQPLTDLLETVGNDDPTWDTDALRRDFEVLGFAAPFVVVRRRADGVLGSLEFTHNPRVYFGWKED